MRKIVLILAIAEIAVFVALVVGGMSGQQANTIDGGLALASVVLAGLVLALFVTPAIILALKRYRLKVALVLALIPPVLYIILVGPRGL